MYGVSLSLMDRIEVSITAANPLAGPLFPRVLNMSFGGAVTRLLAIPLKPIVNGITNAIAAGGTLIVASAGNEGQHVNRTECGWFTCYEVAQWLPCQASNVLCVGGLDTNSTSRATNSNWGEDVRIFAPYWHYAGVESAVPYLYIEPPNEVRSIPGTSFSAPFVAGIGALVAAADRSLSGNQIRELLLDTAVSSPDTQVTRIVQARTAVETAFGAEAFDHQIIQPADGAELVRGATFNARSDRSRSGLAVTWRLDGEEVGSGTTAIQQIPGAFSRELDPGTYELSATVTSGPYTLTRSIDVEIVNEPPTVTIERPEVGAEIYVTDPSVIFRARTTNRERTLEDDEVSWQVERPAGPEFLGTGHELDVVPADLGEGTWTVRAIANDRVDTASDTVEVEVLPEPDVPLPIVSITSPEDGSLHWYEGMEQGVFYADVEFVAQAVESASDGSSLSGTQLRWSSTYQWLQDPRYEEQTEDHGTGNPKVIRITTPGSCTGSTDHYVTVTATNSAGAERSATIRVWTRSPVC